MPESCQLNVNETFDSQKGLVTTKTILALLKALDPAIFPIGKGVLYEIIHQRYHHQREEMLRKKKKAFDQTKKTSGNTKISDAKR